MEQEEWRNGVVTFSVHLVPSKGRLYETRSATKSAAITSNTCRNASFSVEPGFNTNGVGGVVFLEDEERVAVVGEGA